MSRIGLKDVVYAPLTSDPVSGVPTYGTIAPLVGAAVANINPNASSATDFLDDGPSDVAVTIGQSEFNLEIGEISSEVKAVLLGHEYTGGVLLRKGDAVPPFVAVGFRSLKSNGEYRYKWLYKVKFREPEDNSETKGETINFQHDMMIGTFVKLESTGDWEAEADSDDPNVPQSTIDDWFNSVYGTSGDTTAPTFTTVPADAATGVAVGDDIVITFNENMDKATLIDENFILTDYATGTPVPYELTKTDTVVTLNPDSALSALTEYQLIITTAVTDLSGNPIAAVGVVKFTTA